MKLISLSLVILTFYCDYCQQSTNTMRKRQRHVPCLVKMCTNRFSHLLEEHGTEPSTSVDYCLLLKDYMNCINDSFITCLSQLDFHSAITVANQNWQKYNCKKFEGRKPDKTECQFWDEQKEQLKHKRKEEYYDDYENNFYDGNEQDDQTEDESKEINSKYKEKSRRCAIFGHLNVNRFYSNFPERCLIKGAHPLFDSRFLLVQVTIDDVPGQFAERRGHFISKVAVIVRPRKGCVPTQKIYLVDAADPGPISSTFEDGTNEIGEEFSKSVKIYVFEEGIRADIIFYHLATTVRIRKFGNKFLSVLIDSSKRLLDLQHDYFQICTDGCIEKEKNELVDQIKEHCSSDIEEHCNDQFSLVNNDWVDVCVRELETTDFELSDSYLSMQKTFQDLYGSPKEFKSANSEKPFDSLPSHQFDIFSQKQQINQNLLNCSSTLSKHNKFSSLNNSFDTSSFLHTTKIISFSLKIFLLFYSYLFINFIF